MLGKLETSMEHEIPEALPVSFPPMPGAVVRRSSSFATLRVQNAREKDGLKMPKLYAHGRAADSHPRTLNTPPQRPHL